MLNFFTDFFINTPLNFIGANLQPIILIGTTTLFNYSIYCFATKSIPLGFKTYFFSGQSAGVQSEAVSHNEVVNHNEAVNHNEIIIDVLLKRIRQLEEGPSTPSDPLASPTRPTIWDIVPTQEVIPTSDAMVQTTQQIANVGVQTTQQIADVGVQTGSSVTKYVEQIIQVGQPFGRQDLQTEATGQMHQLAQATIDQLTQAIEIVGLQNQAAQEVLNLVIA